MDQPITGPWEIADSVGLPGKTIEIREDPGVKGALVGALVPEGTQVLSITPKKEGIGYQGEVSVLLKSCGQDRVTISDFLPLGDRIIVRLDAKPPLVACPFLESAETARWFVAPSSAPVRLMGLGEIASEKGREQMGIGSQPGQPSSPVTADTVLLESGSEMKFAGRTRSLDGAIWIEVEARLSPAAGIEPPRGFLLPDQLRVAATLTLTRAPSATGTATKP